MHDHKYLRPRQPQVGRWENAAEKVWKDIGGNQEDIMPAEKFSGYKPAVEKRIEIRERLALRHKVKSDKHIRDVRGVELRYRKENIFARSNGNAKSLKLRFHVRDLDLPERRKRYTSSRGKKLKNMHRRARTCGKAVESRYHVKGEE